MVLTMADIFLSYAREDEARAHAVAAGLESRGWSVFWDRRIPTGHDFSEYIQQQINSARCIVVRWSSSVASRFVRDEATEGLDGRLVPALIETVKQPLGVHHETPVKRSSSRWAYTTRRQSSPTQLVTRLPTGRVQWRVTASMLTS